MKKSLVVLAGLLGSAQVLAMSTTDLAKVLNSPEAAILADKNVTELSIDTSSVGTKTSYQINLVAREPGLGMNGPSTHPCMATVNVDTIGGFAGIEWTTPEVSGWICAMNEPMRR